MADGDIIIKKLEAANLDQVSRFRLSKDDEDLQIFIRKHTHKSSQASLTQTYVAKYESERAILGYISLMCAEVALEETYQINDKAGADRYEFQPALRIARLARCPQHKGLNIGRSLVDTAIGVVLLSITPIAGCRFMILDAKPKSISFYESVGFRLLNTESNKTKPMPLMFLDLRSLAD